jgi:hypothetical protein
LVRGGTGGGGSRQTGAVMAVACEGEFVGEYTLR